MTAADDLFAGAGGWDLAAKRLGIHGRGVENMPQAVATRAAAGLYTMHSNVWDFIPDGIAKGEIASPPCQTFSQAGKGEGRKNLSRVLDAISSGSYATLTQLRDLGGDERTALVLTPLHFATQYDYEWLAWEQVPTVLPVWEACGEVLREHGYNVWTGRLHAEQYGVPQTRTRAFLLASRVKEVKPPEPTHSRYYSRDPERLDEGVKPWVSMAEALGWVEDGLMVSNYGSGGDPKNRGVRLFTDPAPTVTSKISRNRLLVSDGGFDYVEPQPDWCFRRPATTIAGDARIPNPGHRCFSDKCHPGRSAASMFAPDAIRVTVQEAGVLQSFPADHPWQGAKGKQYLQVGNAIPPLLAEAALRAVL